MTYLLLYIVLSGLYVFVSVKKMINDKSFEHPNIDYLRSIDPSVLFIAMLIGGSLLAPWFLFLELKGKIMDLYFYISLIKAKRRNRKLRKLLKNLNIKIPDDLKE